MFAISYYQWSSAVATKEHSLHDFLLALTLWLLLKWQRSDRSSWLVSAAGVYALSMTNHMSAAMYAPVIAVLVLVRRRTAIREYLELAVDVFTGMLSSCYHLHTYTSRDVTHT